MPQPFGITLKTNLPETQLKRLERLSQLRDTIANIQIEEMQIAVVMARTLVPVKTGNLQSNIRIEEWNPNDLYIRAGAYTDYAVFVEFGTIHMHARPFWRPPVWEAFYRMKDRIGELL